MDSSLRAPPVDLGVLSIDALDTSPIPSEPWTEADTLRRSENNIAQWLQYLPQDCVNRMIAMRWDVTT